jgi:hypothetical protein
MRQPRLPALLAAAALGLTLGSCANEAEPAADDTNETPTTASSATSATSTTSGPATPTQSSSPTDFPSATESSQTLTSSEQPTATSTRTAAAVDLDELLLPPGRMGKLNAEWRWLTGNDFDTEPDRLVACHRFRLTDIGAEDIAVREFTSDLDANVRAFHLVAGFPDAKTARRVTSVLDSWHGSCRARLEKRSPGKDGVRVSALEPVNAAAAAATSYVVMQPTATGTARIENVGIARDERLVTVVVVKLEGEDFNYPRGRTPAAVGLRNAVGQSR